MSAKPEEAPEAAVVLSTALVKAWTILDVKQSVISKVIGLSPATVSRLSKGEYHLNKKAGDWDAAVTFIRMYHSLAGLLDGDETLMKKWLHTHNTDFGKAPIALLSETGGGVHNLGGYLDSMRGRF
ncbi:antitoxin Xre/MbcA/ParS toxin-binding domain-containing protein [uncultured Deefgea sp.]|uniref:antitoxin Xre/MbcA/ParS toxin-binding domain-containing protein n=1 Tax=uncultured Deefgea sp. TaxID=1304914 RepID=UPI00259198C9|nr:antitoxin Xre/MbcA/ParS toxin-binding domain-containing protein [uncultured Deefgea sp.]